MCGSPPGTLYGALATLTERGWIVSLGDESEGRKKEYQITPAGREAVRAELRRLHGADAKRRQADKRMELRGG